MQHGAALHHPGKTPVIRVYTTDHLKLPGNYVAIFHHSMVKNKFLSMLQIKKLQFQLPLNLLYLKDFHLPHHTFQTNRPLPLLLAWLLL